MEKTVILLYQNGSVCLVLRVAGPDDGLTEALSAAERDWNATRKGLETDFDSFVLEYLTDRGYEVRRDDGFEAYRTCL